MLNQSFKIITILVILGFILPNFSLAQNDFGAAMPQTIGEAKDFAMGILQRLPEAVKRAWREEALPLWQRTWEWVKPLIEPWRNKLLGLLGKEVEKRKPDLKQEFQKEKQEMQKDLWERFKDLWR